VIIGIHAARPLWDLPLRCWCGHVSGVASRVSPSTGFRFVCYCYDCQAFARFLDRPDVLDSAGGTDIFQMPPGRVKLTAGTDAVRCLSLSRKVLRWYTDCCRTPIANTAAGPRFPVVALIHSFVDSGSEAVHEARRSARRCAVSTNAPPSDRSRRRRPRAHRSGSSPAEHRGFSAGGFAGSLDRIRSSTIAPALRTPCRACSPRASTQPIIKFHFVLATATIKLGHYRIWKRAPDRPAKITSSLRNGAVFAFAAP
jgi:Family of unknown function (DUF6151)